MARKRGVPNFVWIAGIVVVALFLFGGNLGGNLFQLGQTTVGTQGTTTSGASFASSGCTSDTNEKAVGFSLANSLNSSGSEYSTSTVRVYQVVDGTEQFFNSVASAAPTSASTINLKCGFKYVAYVAASSSDNSIKMDVDLSTPESAKKVPRIIEKSYPSQHAALIFRVWDNDESDYLDQDGGTDSGSNYLATASTFESVTNGSAKAVGTSGSLNLRVDFKTNETSAADTQFTDQSLVISYAGTDTDYDKTSASLSVSGATATKTDCASLGSKLANDNMDACWVITKDGSPLAVNGGTVHSATFQITAISGVNPTTDIDIYWTSGGYFVKTTASGMGLGVNTDAPSPAYVHTQQKITLNLT